VQRWKFSREFKRARKARISVIASHAGSDPVSAGVWIGGLSAQLVGRDAPQGSVDLLTSVDGPLAGAGDTVTYAYDTQGRLATVTNEVGHVTQVTAWNGAGQPTSITDPNGIVTNLAYDVRNRLTTVTVNPGASQAVTTMEYDAAGQVTKVTAPDGSFLQYTWNDARRLTTVANTTGETIEYGYNANGGRTSATVKSAAGAIVRQQSQVFDELGRLMRSIGAASQTTVLGYDRTDNLTTVTDPRSNLYTFAYDALQRLIRETDQENAEVNYTRDPQDNVTAYTDPRSIATTYVWNGFGEVIQETSPDAGTTVLVRDARGLVTQETDGRGTVSNLAYDTAGRLQTVSYPATPNQIVTYTYDATAGGNRGVGRLTKVQHLGGNIQWTYDALGRIVTERRVLSGKAYTTAYGYDAAGNLTGMTYPSGRVINLTRNSLGKVTAVATQADALATPETVASAIAWKPMSELLRSMTHGNGLVTQAFYDLDYRLTTLRIADGASYLSRFTYAYDDGINLTRINDVVDAANTVTLGYSPANRLASADGPWGNAAYAYDGVGNRLSEIVTLGGNTTTRLASFPASSNRLSGTTENGASLRAYSYDAAGNIVTDTRPGETFAFTYNARNRPTSVTRNGQAWASYGYNALEQLITRSTSAPGGPAGTVHYIHDLEGHIIAEADGATGQTLREYIWLDDLPVGLVTNADTSPILLMVHSDHLARPIRLTGGNRLTLWQATYTPWGEPQSISGTVEQNLRFPGQYFQIETGLAYNWHRHYDPVTGRYTQPDPLGFVDGQLLLSAGIGAFIGGAIDLGTQLALSGGRWKCVKWWQVGGAAALGALGGVGISSNVLKNSASGLKWFGSSRRFSAVSKRVRRANNIGSDSDLHHWGIPNRWDWVPDAIRNHPANLNPVPRALNRSIGEGVLAIDGVPAWAKNWGAAWLGGAAGDITGNVINGCDC
jgi:RHS repeat-associated protein